MTPRAWTLAELTEQLAAALPRLVSDGQPRYRVTEVPDARTVRYYTTLGLVDQPRASRGVHRLYDRGHLLQILAVKKLQAEYLPLRKIAEVLARLTPRDLEVLLGGEFAVDTLLQPEGAPSPWYTHALQPGVEMRVRRGTRLGREELDAVQREVVRILKR